MIFIIVAGLFTIVWTSGLRGPNLGPMRGKQTSSRFFWQFSDDDEFTATSTGIWPKLTHLIIVPGHAVHTCKNIKELRKEACWYLLDYQKGQTDVFLAHIERGIELAKHDSDALLMFSGGQTRGAVGPVSEASSYFNAGMLIGMDLDVIKRVVLEEYAKDSFENLVFSICRFRQITQNFPKKVTVIGFPFKAARFNDLHWPAIQRQLGISDVEFKYVGVGLNEDKRIDDAYGPFSTDPYGEKPPLSVKRKQRDPFVRPHPYSTCFPTAAKLLSK